MPHPLDDSRRRLAWAKANLEALKTDLGSYIASRPCKFPTENADGVLRILPPITVDPPEGVRRNVSQCIDNLRPGLDYVAWKLGTRNPSRPLTEKEERQITFPILTDPTKFQGHSAVKLLREVCAVPAAAIDELERVQPYHAGYEPLETLALLVNPSKHRYCVVPTANTDAATVELTVEGAPIPRCEMQHPDSKAVIMAGNVTAMIVRKMTAADLLNPFQVDEDLARLRKTNDQSLWVSGQAGTAKVDGEVTVFVSIENAPEKPEPVETTLERIISCVEGVIRTFEAHF
jgi:hypothetical protein